ncbi:VOC family protein [Companilactobacillus metriopterae]|uniref:VOC family protein n=1 Tax=Companilactobacillus metriopterae TaxID=1909267 RepID=UPI00100B5C1B|nr:VOC family protein [Companilactobacillus metriopterae]
MNDLVEVMLYVKNVDAEAKFWQNIGFSLIEAGKIGNYSFAKVSPTDNSSLSLCIYDIKFIKENSPEVADNVPSIMFHSDDIDSLRSKMIKLDITVGDLQQMGDNKVFNFKDPNDLYFAVSNK